MSAKEQKEPKEAKQPAVKEHVLESKALVLIGVRQFKPSELTKAVKEMAEKGQIGDWFLTSKSTNSVKAAAKRFGVEVLIRTAGYDDKQKPQLRVWRSDGYDDEVVNEIIQLRMEGKPFPQAKKCEPQTLAQIRRRKSAPVPPATAPDTAPAPAPAQPAPTPVPKRDPASDTPWA